MNTIKLFLTALLAGILVIIYIVLLTAWLFEKLEKKNPKLDPIHIYSCVAIIIITHCVLVILIL